MYGSGSLGGLDEMEQLDHCLIIELEHSEKIILRFECENNLFETRKKIYEALLNKTSNFIEFDGDISVIINTDKIIRIDTKCFKGRTL